MQGSQKPGLSARARKRLTILSIVIFVLLTAALTWYVGRPMIQFVKEPERFRAWVDGHGIWAPLLFVGMMALQVVVAIIPGEPLEIVAGYAFGVWQGTLLCIIGAVVGSAIVFLFVRHFGVKAVEVFFPVEKIRSIKFVKDPKRLNVVVFFAFFIPGTPKDLLAYLVGLTPMKLWVWLLITSTARIPSIITSTIGGDALGLQNYQFAIIVFAITLVISVAGLFIFNKLYKKGNK